MKKWIAVLAILASASTSHARPADDDDDADVIDNKEEARTADREGRERYAAHDYAGAVDAYRRAHDALPEPLFLFDEAQAYRRLHDCAHAAELYRAYLNDLPEADNRRRVEHFIEKMDACTPAPEPQPVHPPLAPPPRPETSNAHTIAAMGIGTGVLGLFLVGTGIYFSIDAGNDQSMIEAMCANGCTGSDVQGLDLAGHASNRNAAITYSIGGAALAASAAMILWAELGLSDEPPAAVTPVAGGAIFSHQTRF